jgi:hypothetical protein
MNQIIDRVKLHVQVAQKQRLYAQMLKDKLHTSPALQQLSEEIAQLNLQLYARSRQ